MKHKCVSFLVLTLLSATAGYSQIVLNQFPSRTVGHPKTPIPEQLTLYSANPNLVEGRELFQPRGVALDTSTTPPILYISDFGNNRVLAWKDSTAFNNGQKADLVIGQPDQYSTYALGPNTKASTGLNSPTGLAVDAQGNLYVADSGNNRVMRFPKPFGQQVGGTLLPDIVIGQPNFTSNGANAPAGALSAKGLALAAGGSTPYQAGLAFDPSGNLFVVDRGNRRVLGYRASDLTSGAAGPAAFVEIGQLSFDQAWPTQLNTGDATSPQLTDRFATPAGIAFDSQGRLYVTDGDITNSNSKLTGRILVFPKQLLTTGTQAIRMYGVFSPSKPPTVQDQIDHVQMFEPQGVAILSDGRVAAMDTWKHRILIFPSVDNLPVDGSAAPAVAVIGHGDFAGRYANNTATSIFTPPASPSSLNAPIAAAVSTSGLFVVDSYNNRLLLLPASGSTFGQATSVLGQDRFDTSAINLVEGREFDFQLSSTQGTSVDAGVAVDSSSSTPHLYVADPYNHRVLGFKDVRQVQAGMPADIVIGQPNLQTTLCNYPSGDVNAPTQSSLCGPSGVVVDPAGNLYVADSLNGRVLRFPNPFAQTGTQTADLVIGKRNFTDTISDPSPSTLRGPYGLAFSGSTGLVVSDQAFNRVLYYRFTSNGTFTAGTDNGVAASKVFGQQRFIDTQSGNGAASLNTPQHVSCDSSGRIYVADSGNNRVIIFNDPNDNDKTPPAGGTAVYIIGGLNGPQGVFVSQSTGEIWVTNTKNSTVLKYPQYRNLVVSGQSIGGVQAPFLTLAVAQDQYGDLFVADASNRVGIYYPAPQSVVNAANYLTTRPLAPGTWASIFSQGMQFSGDTANAAAYPLPTTMADTQVLLAGNPVPLSYVGPTQINFYTPNTAPTSGTADLQILRASTGQILAAGLVQMNNVSPGIFAIDSAGKSRRAAVLNQDSTVNDPSNPAARGSIISIFATGFGSIPNAPQDGSPAPMPTQGGGLITVPTPPEVVIGGYFPDQYQSQPGDPTDGQYIKYSGLAPGFVGLWQINFQIPMGVTPGNQVPLAVVLNNVGSWDASNPNNFITTIAVKTK